MGDIDIESEEGAQAKADQAQSNAESFAESEVESHRSTETHDTAQPPQPHDNEAHDRDFVDEGEAAAAAPVQSVNGEKGDTTVTEVDGNRVYIQSTEPPGDSVGDVWIDNTEAIVNVWNGTQWIQRDPLRASGLTHRWRASNLDLSDGDVVSTWEDMVAGADLSAAGAPSYKEDVIGGQPVVRFDGVDDFMTSSYADSISQPHEIYTVAQLRATTSELQWLHDGESSDEHIFRSNDNDTWESRAGTSSYTGSNSDTDVHVFRVLFDGSDSQFDVDDTTDGTGSVSVVTSNGMTLCARSDNNFNGNWDVAECLHYERPLTSQGRADLYSYVNTQYGISV